MHPSIRDRASQYEADGLPKQDALRRSVQWHHDEAQSQLASVHDQLRQQYPELLPESAAATKPTEVATPNAAAPASLEKPPVQTTQVETGISDERLRQIYGNDAIVSGQGRGTSELKRIGRSDTRDPYSVLSQAQQRGIATPEDAALLRVEHQRLLDKARASYGTPEYNNFAQQAVDFANATKDVAHTPASDIMRGLQEPDIPKYDSPADFDAIVRERMGRESTPDEKSTFEKTAADVGKARDKLSKSASSAQSKLSKLDQRKSVSFDDAADYVRKQIAELTKNCLT